MFRVVPRLRLHQDPAVLNLYDQFVASAYSERFSSLSGHDNLMLPAHSNNRAQSSSRVTILYALYNIAFALPRTNQEREGQPETMAKEATPDPMLLFTVTRSTTNREMSTQLTLSARTAETGIAPGEEGTWSACYSLLSRLLE